MWVAFALQKLLTFFSKKFHHICISLDVNFNESLTNNVVSFEQLGPEELSPLFSSVRQNNQWNETNYKVLHFVDYRVNSWVDERTDGNLHA